MAKLESHQIDEHQSLADSKLPRHIRVLMHYMHSLTEIWEFYRAQGSKLPPVFQAELKRAEDELTIALENEAHQGGALHDYYSEQMKKESKR